jgi:hypothetical protein
MVSVLFQKYNLIDSPLVLQETTLLYPKPCPGLGMLRIWHSSTDDTFHFVRDRVSWAGRTSGKDRVEGGPRDPRVCFISPGKPMFGMGGCHRCGEELGKHRLAA